MGFSQANILGMEGFETLFFIRMSLPVGGKSGIF
jgi:hypothetical protein